MLFALTCLVASTVLGLAIVEGALRLAGTESSVRAHFRPGIYVRDPELGWGLKQGYRGVRFDNLYSVPTSTNALGFRGPEWDTARRDAEFRVLALGDSCTFGLGVRDDDSFPARVEASLRDRGLDAAVFNAGVPGYDTAQEARLLERLAPIVRPHVVVVAWLPNDAVVQTKADLLETHVLDGYLVDDVERYRAWRDKIDRRGIYRSALYRFFRVRMRLLGDFAGGRRLNGFGTFEADDLEPSMRALARIRERSDEIGARVVVVTLPRREQAEGSMPAADLRYVADHWRSRGVDVVEMLPSLRELDADIASLYLNDNVHLTASGYREMGEAVAALMAPLP